MIDEMYYDAFANEYVTSKDSFAPPERYILARRGTFQGEYIERFKVRKNGVESFYDFVFTEEEWYNYDLVIRTLNSVKEENGFIFARHTCEEFTLPPEKFDEYVKRFGIYEGELS